MSFPEKPLSQETRAKSTPIPDDVQSLIRLLLYANDLKIEALIASAGTLANIARKQNILKVLDEYEKVQPNLAKQRP